jgi:hypothetical protein
MLRLNDRQRAVIADKLPDMANLVAAALVVGWILGEPRTSDMVLAPVLALWTLVIGIAVLLRREQ